MSNTIKAKFTVSNVGKDASGNETITAYAVWGGGAENNSYSEATPSGSFQITVSNDNVKGWIEPGDDLVMSIEIKKKL